LAVTPYDLSRSPNPRNPISQLPQAKVILPKIFIQKVRPMIAAIAEPLRQISRATSVLVIMCSDRPVKRVCDTRGQTMTQYALILTAIAIVVYGGYRLLGNNIGSLVSGVDSSLTTANRRVAQGTPIP
jgi:Flp pilus assembly pilin Flp